MSAPITLSLVEDEAGLRDLLSRKFQKLEGFRFQGAFADGESALESLLARPTDLVVTDWKLPGLDGVELIGRLKQAHPALRAVLITGYQLEHIPFAAFVAGADGFLLKPLDTHEIPARLREAHAGKCPVSAGVARLLVEHLRKTGHLHSAALLSHREGEVLQLLGEGLLTKEVGSRLGISEHTVVSFKRRLFEKLGVHNVAEALLRWHRGKPLPAACTTALALFS